MSSLWDKLRFEEFSDHDVSSAERFLDGSLSEHKTQIVFDFFCAQRKLSIKIRLFRV